MIILSSSNSFSQDNSWEGTDFVFTQPNTHFILINIKICSNEDIVGTISFQNTIINFNNELTKCASITIDKAMFDSMLHSGINKNKGIKINTNKRSTCYITIFNTAEDEGFGVLPINSLGNEYSDVDFDKLFSDTLANHSIVSIEDNTLVDITIQNTIAAQYNLQKNDVLVIRKLPNYKVNSNKPIAFFASAKSAIKGSNCTGCCSEELYEQVLPDNFLGKTYILNTIHANNESIVLINAISDNTCIEIDGENYTLQEKENIRYYTNGNSIIRASNNIKAFRIFESNACMTDGFGDPELFQLPSIEDLTISATFYPANGYFQKRFLNIIIPKESLDSIYLDNIDIKDRFGLLNEFYYAAEFEISQATHTLNAKKGFQAFTYSISNSMSGPNSAGYYIRGSTLISPYQFKTNNSFKQVDLCNEETYEYFSSDTSSDFNWNDGFSSSHRTLTDSGIYIVQVNNVCLNYNYIDTIKVNKLQCRCTPKVPGIFSPNNDGKNDFLTIEFDCSLSTNFNLKIFNRWGILIHENDNYKNNWDGMDKTNNECAEGAYVYYISYVDEKQNAKSTTGVFYLIK